MKLSSCLESSWVCAISSFVFVAVQKPVLQKPPIQRRLVFANFFSILWLVLCRGAHK